MPWGNPWLPTLLQGAGASPAWLAEAGDALASMVLPAGCQLCEQLLTGASRLPVCEDCLASFSRWEAVRGAFATRPGSQVDKRRVLLVDDVMTNGANTGCVCKGRSEERRVGKECRSRWS